MGEKKKIIELEKITEPIIKEGEVWIQVFNIKDIQMFSTSHRSIQSIFFPTWRAKIVLGEQLDLKYYEIESNTFRIKEEKNENER